MTEADVQVEVAHCAGCQNARDLGRELCGWHEKKLLSLKTPNRPLVDLTMPYGSRPKKHQPPSPGLGGGLWKEQSRQTYKGRTRGRAIPLADASALAAALSQRQARCRSVKAAARECGVSPYTLSLLRQGQREGIRRETARVIAAWLGVPLGEVIAE